MRNMRGFLAKAVILGVVVMVMGVAGSGNAAAAGKARFVDNGDGTITDNLTGLMWEKKTPGDGMMWCKTLTDCPDPTNVDNLYSWSSSGTAPDGPLFTDFLAKMNCALLQDGGTCGSSDPITGKVTRYRDWRIPTIAELRTILAAQWPNCPSSPCVEPIFGPTATWNYWSSSSYANDPAGAWYVTFAWGQVGGNNKAGGNGYARAVRGGL